MIRWAPVAGCLALALGGCTTPDRPTDHTAPPATPAATAPSVFTTVPRATSTPTPATFRYSVNDLQLALPSTYGTHKLEKSNYIYPPGSDVTRRPDPMAVWKVEPAICRDVIRYLGVPGVPGDFIAPTTPSAVATARLGQGIGNERPFVSASITELAGALGDRLLDQRRPPPPECAHILIDGKERASVVERPLPGFGVRARYIVRTYPVGPQTYTERTLQYRTPTYVVLIRLDAFINPEPAFLAFAAKTRDGLKSLTPMS
ncbi:hypothetical protein OHA18_17375 [Kribbella sp. NBC_00709]|uniref:hypothetical protein n=1 Tax=Kribbella sp. NBC_00709 TaxID=2975972 RepID=UPI002E2C5347|nr:hypothetical protein [Kribbella sp. NBC_00709]